MAKKAVSPEMAARVFALREEVDGWGDHVHSCDSIAQMLGVSESTIWRVVAKKSAYAGRNVVTEKKQLDAQWKALEAEAFGDVKDDALDAAAKASEEKLMKALEGKKELSWTEQQLSAEALERRRLFTEVPVARRVMPPSPLDEE